MNKATNLLNNLEFMGKQVKALQNVRGRNYNINAMMNNIKVFNKRIAENDQISSRISNTLFKIAQIDYEFLTLTEKLKLDSSVNKKQLKKLLTDYDRYLAKYI
jgi:hypothetical protein